MMMMNQIISDNDERYWEKSWERMNDYISNPENKHVVDSLNVIEEALNRYGLEGICLSFNGGKDCTVLLHLTQYAIHRWHRSKEHSNMAAANAKGKVKLTAHYCRLPNGFPEMDEFVHETVQRYDLELVISENRDMKSAIADLLAQYPRLQAFLLGSRTSDFPCHIQMKPFQMTDPHWPQVMRISPLLQWTYAQVWHFLRNLNVPYCCLYDRGYTSIGSKLNTHPNPKLLSSSKNGETATYLPAYMLEDENEERQGRS